MITVRRSAWAAGVAATLCAAGLIAPAVAQAKSDIEIGVSARTVHLRQPLHVTAVGGSDNVGHDTLVCVQQLGLDSHHHPAWHAIACTPPTSPYQAGERLHITLHPTQVGTLQLRAQLYDADLRGHHPHPVQASGAVAVRVVR